MEKESDGTLEEKPSEKIWTDNIEKVLDHLRLNCAQLSNYHRYRYVYYKRQVKWFKIPIIILSGINTFIAVGMVGTIGQFYVSIITSVVSLFCGIITGIEMFMKFQDKMVMELNTHRDYYKISIEIYKVISIDRKSREISGVTFLDAKFSDYEKIKSRSNPEQHFNLVHDILADEEDLIIFKRDTTKTHKKGWVNKIELAPPLHDRDRINYDINLGYDKYRDPLKWMLRERTKKIEGKKKMTQKYLDQKWIERSKEQEKKEAEERLDRKLHGNKHDMISSPRRRKTMFEPNNKNNEALNRENLYRMASQEYEVKEHEEDSIEKKEQEEDSDEKREQEEEDSDEKKENESVSSGIEHAISIKVNERDEESDCDSDYPCPMSERNGFSIINFFRPRRKSLFYESDSSEETEPIPMMRLT